MLCDRNSRHSCYVAHCVELLILRVKSETRNPEAHTPHAPNLLLRIRCNASAHPDRGRKTRSGANGGNVSSAACEPGKYVGVFNEPSCYNCSGRVGLLQP